MNQWINQSVIQSVNQSIYKWPNKGTKRINYTRESWALYDYFNTIPVLAWPVKLCILLIFSDHQLLSEQFQIIPNDFKPLKGVCAYLQISGTLPILPKSTEVSWLHLKGDLHEVCFHHILKILYFNFVYWLNLLKLVKIRKFPVSLPKTGWSVSSMKVDIL